MAKSSENKDSKESTDKIYSWIKTIIGLFILLFCYYKFILKSSHPIEEAYSKSIKEKVSKQIADINIFAKTSNVFLDRILTKDTIHLEDILDYEPFVDYLDNIDYTSSDGTTLLIAMAKAKDNQFILPSLRHKFKSMIAKVLSKKPNLNHTDKYGRTALIWNTITGSEQFHNRKRFTLKHDSLLMSYDYHYYFETQLLKNEAARKTTDNFGKTALQYASDLNFEINYFSLLN